MAEYTPPAGDAVNFVFTDSGYSAPAGDSVDFVFYSDQTDDALVTTFSNPEEDEISTFSVIETVETVSDTGDIITGSVLYGGESVTEDSLVITASWAFGESVISDDAAVVTWSTPADTDETVARESYPPRFYFLLNMPEEQYPWETFRPTWIPISSFQARWNYKVIGPESAIRSVFLSVSIPGTEYADIIADAPASWATMEMYMDVLKDSGEISKVRFLPAISINAASQPGWETSGMSVEISNNNSIALSASLNSLMWTTAAPFVHELDGFTESKVADGTYSYKFPLANPWIKAGDSALIDGNTFRIYQITHSVSLDSGGLTMDLSGY